MSSNDEARYFDETAPKRAFAAVQPQVEEMCKHLLKEKQRYLAQFAPEHHAKLLPQYKINDVGHARLAQTREDFELLLNPWKRELGLLMVKWPRRERQTIASYHAFLSEAGDNWGSRFERMGNLLAHLHRIHEEERAEREREAAQRKLEEEAEAQREREHRAALERQATIDPKEVKRLLAVIDDARKVEEMLALHKRAEAARGALRSMYAREREACQELGRPVPERSVPEAAGTLDDGFAIGFLAGSSNQRPKQSRPVHSPMRKG
jgi:hypothetical protein